MKTPPSAQSHRRRLLLGAALAALPGALASPALADNANDLTAFGANVIAADQSQMGSVGASAANPVIIITGQPTASSVDLSGNTVSASARANDSAASVVLDALDLSAAPVGTRLSTSAYGSMAMAPVVVATRQLDTGLVSARTSGSVIGASLGNVGESSVVVGGNAQEATALANNESGTLALTHVLVGTGAGVLSDQMVAGNAAIAMGVTARASLETDEVTASDLALTSNLQRAIGYGNSAANTLSSDGGHLSVTTNTGPASSIDAGANQPSVNAAYAVLGNQRLASGINVNAAGGFAVKVDSSADSSRLGIAANMLAAVGYGNQSSNGLTLAAASIDNGNTGAAVADVTNVQTASSVPITATSIGGASLHVGGDAIGSDLSATGNSVLSEATANRADGNLLSVSAATIDARAATIGYPFPPPLLNLFLPYIGTASVGSDGTMSVTAPFSVQNDQQSGSSVSARAADAVTAVTVGGDIANASLLVADGTATVHATANSAANGLTLAGTDIATAADLNNFQRNTGSVTASLGTALVRAGAIVAGTGDVLDARLTVSGNSLAGTASGNIATNTLTATGTSLTNVSGHSDAEAGRIDAGTGAAADYALANNQQVDGSAITSSVYGTFSAQGAGGVTGTSLNVTSNSQTATALANGATNALALTAANLGSDIATAPGAALSSVQSGIGNVYAVSNLQLGLSGSAADSALTLSGNSNRVNAGMNQAANSLTVDAVATGSLSGLVATASDGGGAGATGAGDVVLASTQSADGRVAANAVTQGLVTGAGLVGSSYAASGNETLAEATANAVTNSLTLNAASSGSLSAGLSNVQQSEAAVTSIASSAFGAMGGAVINSNVRVDNNSTAAYALGNQAANSLSASDARAPGLAGITSVAFNSASGSAALNNVQTNAGAVMAASYSPAVSVSYGGGGTSGSSLGVSGNRVTAAAYGNSATNSVMLASLDGQPRTAAISNVQSNTGAVSARVVSASYTITPISTGSSRLALVGNSITASAVGNAAVSTITTAR